VSGGPWIHNSENTESLLHYPTDTFINRYVAARFSRITGDDEISRDIGKQFTCADEACDGFHVALVTTGSAAVIDWKISN